jgi:hypothetical protein
VRFFTQSGQEAFNMRMAFYEKILNLSKHPNAIFEISAAHQMNTPHLGAHSAAIIIRL